MNVGVGDNYLHILPYFATFGLGSTHMGFSSADNLIEIPDFQPKNLGKNIAKYRPAVLMGTPNRYLSLPTDPSLKQIDLSFIRTIGYGGDSITAAV